MINPTKVFVGSETLDEGLWMFRVSDEILSIVLQTGIVASTWGPDKIPQGSMLDFNGHLMVVTEYVTAEEYLEAVKKGPGKPIYAPAEMKQALKSAFFQKLTPACSVVHPVPEGSERSDVMIGDDQRILVASAQLEGEDFERVLAPKGVADQMAMVGSMPSRNHTPIGSKMLLGDVMYKVTEYITREEFLADVAKAGISTDQFEKMDFEGYEFYRFRPVLRYS